MYITPGLSLLYLLISFIILSGITQLPFLTPGIPVTIAEMGFEVIPTTLYLVNPYPRQRVDHSITLSFVKRIFVRSRIREGRIYRRQHATY
jgi:hypothetical protein